MKTKRELGLEVLKELDYKFFVVDSDNNILSGWEYKEDAKDSQFFIDEVNYAERK